MAGPFCESAPKKTPRHLTDDLCFACGVQRGGFAAFSGPRRLDRCDRDRLPGLEVRRETGKE
jgi:hypothetical protein